MYASNFPTRHCKASMDCLKCGPRVASFFFFPTVMFRIARGLHLHTTQAGGGRDLPGPTQEEEEEEESRRFAKN